MTGKNEQPKNTVAERGIRPSLLSDEKLTGGGLSSQDLLLPSNVFNTHYLQKLYNRQKLSSLYPELDIKLAMNRAIKLKVHTLYDNTNSVEELRKLLDKMYEDRVLTILPDKNVVPLKNPVPWKLDDATFYTTVEAIDFKQLDKCYAEQQGIELKGKSRFAAQRDRNNER